VQCGVVRHHPSEGEECGLQTIVAERGKKEHKERNLKFESEILECGMRCAVGVLLILFRNPENDLQSKR
jgi:hypothetical protein